MDDKVTPARIAAYAARLARRVCDTAYATTPAVEGAALLSLTPVRPLNLLVLHGIAGQWQAEAARLRSPYFDYGAEAVQTALTALLNTLSRHIRVERAALEPLLQRAAEDVLGLVFAPADTFERRFGPADDTATVTPEALRANLKYVGVNQPLFEEFIDSLHGAPLDRAALRKRLALHLTSHYKDAASPEALLAELNACESVKLTDLQESVGAAAPVAASTPVAAAITPPPPVTPPRPTAPEPVRPPEPVAVPVAKTPPVAPAPPVTPPVVTPPVAAPASAAPAAPSVVPPAPVEVPKPVPVVAKAAETPKAPPVSAPAPALGGGLGRLASIVPDTPAQPLHEKFRTEKTNLNDHLRSHEAPGLAEKLETTAKVESLQKAVTINQRFAFTNELFDGDREGFVAALTTLDALPTAEQARAYVTGPAMRGSHNWAGKDEHIQKLLKLIERKFA